MGVVKIYTDGCCLKNPGGAGGWAAIIIRPGGSQELHGGCFASTNNRMEMRAAIEGLKALSDHDTDVIVYSDSQYLVKGMTVWIKGWLRRKWATATGGDVKNVDLWKELLELCMWRSVEWKWVRGHDGNWHNERCDELAGRSARSPSVHDAGYQPSS